MKNVTLNLIRNNYKNNNPCEESWIKLLKSLNKTKADDDPISFEYLLETLGVQDTLWVIDNCIEDKSVVRLMCADFAESVLHIWENWAKDNAPDHLNAPRRSIELCRINSTKEEFADAWDADADADWVAAAAADAAWAADAAETEKQKEIILKYFGNKK